MQEGLIQLPIKTDGTLWAWGNNDHGQIEDETTDDRYSPVKIYY